MANRGDSRTYAQRRRAYDQEATRKRLNAAQYIRRLLEISEKLDTCEASLVPALRLKVDIYSKLLNKCLPDLKATEITGTLTHKRAEELTDEELYAIAARGRESSAEEESGAGTTH